MKNREKYAQEIINTIANMSTTRILPFGVDMKTRTPKLCGDIECDACLLGESYDCNIAKWLDEECESDKAVKETISLQTVLYLNAKTGKHFRPTNKAAKRCINARLNEGYTLDDFCKVIDIKAAEWTGTDYEKYLNPETLFGNKMDKYLNQPVQKPPEDKRLSKWGD